MAQLAIKGHATRGKEVIELLEMMGGHNGSNLLGNNSDYVYFITDSGDIDSIYADYILTDYFTLKKFLEKYPYKVGDKVLYKTYGIYSKIKSMCWNQEKEQVFYRLESEKLFVATEDELHPCKEA